MGHSARRQKADGESEFPDLTISPTDFKHRGGSRSEGTLVSLRGWGGGTEMRGLPAFREIGLGGESPST